MTKVVFSCPVPEYHLTITKTYELVKVDGDPATEPDAKAYHLVLTLQVTNNDTKKHEVAYRLDGPNGLPVEGSWYVTSKVGRTGPPRGSATSSTSWPRANRVVATASQLSEKFYKEIGEATRVQRASAAVLRGRCPVFLRGHAPRRQIDRRATSIARVALRVGDVAEQRKTLTNTSFRLISKPLPMEAGGKSPAATLRGLCRPETAATPGEIRTSRA